MSPPQFVLRNVTTLTLYSANTALHLCFHHSSLLSVRPRDRSVDRQVPHAAPGHVRVYGWISISRVATRMGFAQTHWRCLLRSAWPRRWYRPASIAMATTDDETMDRNLFGKMLAAHLPDEQALTSAPAH